MLTRTEERYLLLNCILVEEGVRRAFFIDVSPHIRKDMEYVVENFPDLLFTDFGNSKNSVLVSKEPLNESEFCTEERLGRLLGYPCADGFSTLDRFKTHYNHKVMVWIKEDSPMELFNDVGQALTDHTALVNAMRDAFLRNVNSRDIVTDVFVITKAIVPENYLIEKLIGGKPFTNDETSEFENYTWNMELHPANPSFKLTSEFHRGIAAALLVFSQRGLTLPDMPVEVGSEKLAKAAVDLISILSKSTRPSQ